MDWNDESVRKLRVLWVATNLDGKWTYSTSKIGRILGTTKNAVIGKAGRIGLDSRQSPIRRHGEGQNHLGGPREPYVHPGAKILRAGASTLAPLLSLAADDALQPVEPSFATHQVAPRKKTAAGPAVAAAGRLTIALLRQELGKTDTAIDGELPGDPPTVFKPRAKDCLWCDGDGIAVKFAPCEARHFNAGPFCDDHKKRAFQKKGAGGDDEA